MNTQPPYHPFLKTSILLAIIIVCLAIASFFPKVVADLIFAILTAFLFKPIVTFLEVRFEIPKSLAALIVLGSVGGTAVLALYLLFPLAVKSIGSMLDNLVNFPFDERLKEMMRNLAGTFPLINSDVAAKKIHAVLQNGLDFLETGLTSAVGYAAILFIVPFIAYFLLADGDKAVERFIEYIPNKYFEMTLNVLYKIKKRLVGYLKGWIMECTIIGVLSIIGLSVLGVNYAVFIGTAAGVANLVPYLGPIVGASLAVIVSMTQTGNFSMLGPILLLTLLIRIVDDVVVQPICFASSIEMHPLAVVLILLFGHELMGVAGLVLAMPTATVLKTIATETYWGLKHYQITSSSSA